MIYRFRIILDVKEDVLRDIEIEETASFEEFHHAITQAFGFLGNEMASFYLSDEQWIQGEELPLEAMDSAQKSYSDQPLNSVFSATQHHLIYIYDFFNLWTFFVELMEVAEPGVGMAYPNLINAQGEVPEEAPEKFFESDTTDTPEEEGIDDQEEEGFDEADFY